MEGAKQHECVRKQRRLNQDYYDSKATNGHETGGASQEQSAKVARTTFKAATTTIKSDANDEYEEQELTDDDIVKRYFGVQSKMAKVTIDDEISDNLTTESNVMLMTNSVNTIITCALINFSLTIADDGAMLQMQMDSGCCGMSMLSDPRYFVYGLVDGHMIKIHTSAKRAAKSAKAYGIAAGSVPTILNLETRKPGPRKAMRTGLAICDDAIHDLVNENRFDINLDDTPTPHRVDKKNRCIWMYEGTPSQFIVPLDYNRDALYVDYRPLAADEQVAFVKVNPLRTDQWSLDSPLMARDSIEVMDVSNEFDDSDCEDFISHAHKPCDRMIFQRSATERM
jgi:hypothetical protein